MKFREMMVGNDENLGWCKPVSFLGGKVIAAVNGGNVCSLRNNGLDVDVTPDSIRRAAEMVNGDYSMYQGWDDTHIMLDADCEELPCRCCPWFGICDAMDEEA